MKMIWSEWKIKENCHVLANQFFGNFRSKTLGCWKIKPVFRDVKWCFNASCGLKGLRCELLPQFLWQGESKISTLYRMPNCNSYMMKLWYFKRLVIFHSIFNVLFLTRYQNDISVEDVCHMHAVFSMFWNNIKAKWYYIEISSLYWAFILFDILM